VQEGGWAQGKVAWVALLGRVMPTPAQPGMEDMTNTSGYGLCTHSDRWHSIGRSVCAKNELDGRSTEHSKLLTMSTQIIKSWLDIDSLAERQL
jgi:hypothetical protein